jgi:hypothetical protein
LPAVTTRATPVDLNSRAAAVIASVSARAAPSLRVSLGIPLTTDPVELVATASGRDGPCEVGL